MLVTVTLMGIASPTNAEDRCVTSSLIAGGSVMKLGGVRAARPVAVRATYLTMGDNSTTGDTAPLGVVQCSSGLGSNLS